MNTYNAADSVKDSYREYDDFKSDFNVKKRKKIFLVPEIIILVMLVLNLLSWLSTDFSDWYVKYIFPVFNNSITRITGAVPFSIGEILIITGILVVIILPVAFVVCMILCRRHRKKVLRITGCFLAWVFTYIIATETLNCFIMYHCTTIKDNMYSNKDGHTQEQLLELSRIVIAGANKYSALVERDNNGELIAPDNISDMAENALHNVNDMFPLLKGYFPDAKPLRNSDVMTQMDLAGIYFPFTLESNYNDIMYPCNYGDTICHEFCHLKGYIFEDEANFIAYVACTEYDNDYMKYCGYMSAINYVLKEVRLNCDEETKNEVYGTVLPAVWDDNIFVKQEMLDEIEKNAIVSSETASEISDTAIDTSLKVNGVQDGKISYSRMVNLLLDYYF